jgi:phytoene dehydrogenase-like protein
VWSPDRAVVDLVGEDGRVITQGKETADAVVIGAGPNGLVAAARLADAGWDVVLLEANDEVGGAVRSALLHPGYTADLFSAFYPLAAASPAIVRLDLHHHGLRWAQSPTVVAHPHPPTGADGERAAILHQRAEDTAAALEHYGHGDGDTWLELAAEWQRLREPLLRALTGPFPPVRAAVKLLWRAGGTPAALRLARRLLLPVTRLCDELFTGPDGKLLLAGNAMHADIPAVSAASGGFGWLMTMLAQDVGFPVPVGGSGMLTQAMAARARAAGVQIVTGSRVERVLVSGRRARGVVTADGRRIAARRAVLADVSAPVLYGSMLPPDALPSRLLAQLRHFDWDLPTVKVNWALDGPVPWRAEAVGAAATVHLGADDAQLAEWSAALAAGRPSEHVFLLLGQMAIADPSRAPAGGESVWAYSHLPRERPGSAPDPRAARDLAERMERTIEHYAPGFVDRIVHRAVQLPGDLEEADANLGSGAVNGGTAQLHQQVIFRPLPGLGRAETPVAGLYLAGSAAHPGGGVHGGAGDSAARAALHGSRLLGVPNRLFSTANRHLAGD